MADITYCKNPFCPFLGCDRHLKNAPARCDASIASLDATCRRYITWLVKQAEKEEHHETR